MKSSGLYPASGDSDDWMYADDLLTKPKIYAMTPEIGGDNDGFWPAQSRILPICKNTDGIAAVMGHEVAHAFAKHGQERMTSAYGQQLGGIAVAIGTNNKDPKAQQLWNTIYGVGSQIGMLAYSRTHETEADKLGMVFMIMAGYKPQEAVNVWIRMSQRASSGNAPPEFLSTHPSNETRIANLKAYLPTAIKLANKYNVR